jgi:hypothetical protein
MLRSVALVKVGSRGGKYKEGFAEDVLLHVRKHSSNQNVRRSDAIVNQTLILLEDKVLKIGGQLLNKYGLPTPHRDQHLHIHRHMLRETSYDSSEMGQYVDQYEPLLTPDQYNVYKSVLYTIDNRNGELIFLDAPGGTGKTFLIILLLAQVRQTGKITLVAASGIPATLLTGGRTAHSAFKLPLNLAHCETPTCNIKKTQMKHVFCKMLRLLSGMSARCLTGMLWRH